MNVADSHNFGKSVEKIRRASGNWFQKPRTVFWEWLFFGKDSPLADVFREPGDNSEKLLSDFLFNLEIEITNEWLGYSKELVEEKINQLTASHFYGFGILLAYSYIFGIRDLHRQNLILTNTHLQPVDVEVVLTKLVLPSETLLLPFKGIGYEFAGIGRLAGSPKEFSPEQIRQLFAGYFDLFACARLRKDAIAHILTNLDLAKHPARVIIRNTSEYGHYLHGKRDFEPMESEKVQMDRGDIPYYFKCMGDDTLKWLSQPNIYGVERDLKIFSPDVARHAQSPLALLETNLSESKMVQGAMQLVHHLNNETSLGFTLANNIAIEFPNSVIKVGSATYAVK